jgi:hypothetical protein
MHRAARREARQSGELKRLGDDALSDDSGIGVKEQSKDTRRILLLPKILPGAHAAEDNRIDRFEM